MNTLGDLNNKLFEQLERLSNKNLNDKELAKEIERAKAIKDISTQIISNANTVLRAKAFSTNTLGRSQTSIPRMLDGE